MEEDGREEEKRKEEEEGREQVTTFPRPSQGCHPRMRGFVVVHTLPLP
jgi:hypothetical protein